MIDTHCHLNYPPLIDEIDMVIERAQESGVQTMIIPGTDIGTSESAIAFAHMFPGVWAAVGIHPHHVHESSPEDLDRLRALAIDHRVVAIGEIGLDYSEELSDDAKLLQDGFARQMVQIAKEVGKPLIIHSRDCFEDLYALLKEEASGHNVVIHCFTGTKEEAQKWLDLGFHLSFTGIVTYKNADNLREVVKMIPADRFMIETDAPYLAPQPHRGHTCEPSMVRYVAETIAECRGVSAQEVIKQTTVTAQAFFKFSA